MLAIECVDMTKTYSKHVTALYNLTLNINEGTSFGLLGENGAGKSTLVRIIMGFIYPTSGSIRVLGESQVARAHLRIGYVHERPILLALLLVWSYHSHAPQVGIQDATFSNMLPGALGLLLDTILVATLTIVLYRPLATRLLQILFLLWCVALLYSNTAISSAAQYLSIVRLPLVPVTVCYSLGTGSALDIYSFAMLLAIIGYILALVFLAVFLLNRRDLILH